VEIVKILRALFHRRVLVALVALVAVLVGLLLSYRVSLPPESRQTKVGLATTRILVDTPRSQVVEVSPRGSETLGARATVIANLMAEGEVKAAIARRAGLRPAQLVASAESAVGGGPDTSSQASDSPSQASGSDAHLLTIGVLINADGLELPIIKIDTQAPDARQATKLANATVAGLRDYLDSKAAAEEVSNARRLRVTGLGAAQAHEEVRGPGPAIALAAAIFVFLIGCAAILLMDALARGWRQAIASEYIDPSELSSEDGGFDGSLEDDGVLDLFAPDRRPMGADESTEPWADDTADARSPLASADDLDLRPNGETRARSA
jgi:capsular polysaccharide biosynthesis protein